MAAFGPRVAGRNAIQCPLLAEQGIELYFDQRKNGRLCLQIRQKRPKRLRLKAWSSGALVAGTLSGSETLIGRPNRRAGQSRRQTRQKPELGQEDNAPVLGNREANGQGRDYGYSDVKSRVLKVVSQFAKCQWISP